jgi:hypothetical protein
VRLSLQKQPLGKAFHLMNPQITPWSSLIDYLRSFGYPLQGRPYIEWRRAIERSPENALYPLLPTLDGKTEPQDGKSRGTLNLGCYNLDRGESININHRNYVWNLKV